MEKTLALELRDEDQVRTLIAVLDMTARLSRKYTPQSEAHINEVEDLHRRAFLLLYPEDEEVLQQVIAMRKEGNF